MATLMQSESDTLTTEKSEARITEPRYRLLTWPPGENLIKVVPVGLMVFDGALAGFWLMKRFQSYGRASATGTRDASRSAHSQPTAGRKP